jgi:chromosome segregation ATPase
MTEVLKTPVGKTKNDIWKAYKELRDELSQSENDQPTTTTAVAQRKSVEKATKVASSLDVTNLSQGVTDLMANIDQAKAAYEELQTAINAKRQELKDVHGLETEANSYIALVSAKERLIEEREEQADEIIREAKENATLINQEAHEAKVQQQRQHNRLEEEWQYTFNRQKRNDQDRFSDDLNKEIQKIDERINAVEAREAKMDELEKQKAALETKLDDAIQKTEQRIEVAVAEAKERTQKSANIAKAMESNTFKAEMRVKDAEIENLKERFQEAQDQLKTQQILVQEAQTKVSEMAQASLRARADAATVAKVSEIAAGSGKK